MISVVGEALVDLVITPDGAVSAKLGGAPFNTARACARLGAEVRFAGAISVDRFGSMLADQLAADGVDVTHAARVDAPTTLAAAELDESGAATYRFYIDGTSAPMLDRLDPSALAADVVFTGGLGLVLEPMASTVEAAIRSNRDRFVVVDVNCRPQIVPVRDAYVARVERILPHVDVLKVSDEDLAFLGVGDDPVAAARELLAAGPSAVLVTRGGDGVHVLTAGGSTVVAVQPVDVVDTIGAGDSFGAGFLASWIGSERGRDEAADLDGLVQAVQAANQVAGVVVTRRGADPPWRHELPAGWSS